MKAAKRRLFLLFIRKSVDIFDLITFIYGCSVNEVIFIEECIAFADKYHITMENGIANMRQRQNRRMPQMPTCIKNGLLIYL